MAVRIRAVVLAVMMGVAVVASTSGCAGEPGEASGPSGDGPEPTLAATATAENLIKERKLTAAERKQFVDMARRIQDGTWRAGGSTIQK